MSAYKYSIGKEEKHLKRVAVITTENPDRGLEKHVRAVTEAIYISRDIANAPSNRINPEGFEKEVKKILSGLEYVSIRVFRQRELEKEELERKITKISNLLHHAEENIHIVKADSFFHGFSSYPIYWLF